MKKIVTICIWACLGVLCGCFCALIDQNTEANYATEKVRQEEIEAIVQTYCKQDTQAQPAEKTDERRLQDLVCRAMRQ